MAQIRVGYACQNLSLPATTSRTTRLDRLDETRLRDLVAANLQDLGRILEWNVTHGIGLFRIGSHLVPFASHPNFPYDWLSAHRAQLASAGEHARGLGQRLSFHPGQYVNPGSTNPAVVAASLAELRYTAGALGAVGLPDSVIVLHLGGAYGDKPAALRAFVRALETQTDILRFLALENDERIWTPDEVARAAAALGVPVILDTLHHALNPGAWSLEEAIARALPTWGMRRPKLHISTQDPDKLRGAHAGYIDRRDWKRLVAALDGYTDVDVMIEAKEKDRAALRILRGNTRSRKV